MRISIAEETMRKMLEREERIRKSLEALHAPQPTELTKEEWAKVLAETEDGED